MSKQFIDREIQAQNQNDGLIQQKNRKEEAHYAEKQARRHAEDKRCTEYESGTGNVKYGKCK